MQRRIEQPPARKSAYDAFAAAAPFEASRMPEVRVTQVRRHAPAQNSLLSVKPPPSVPNAERR